MPEKMKIALEPIRLKEESVDMIRRRLDGGEEPYAVGEELGEVLPTGPYSLYDTAETLSEQLGENITRGVVAGWNKRLSQPGVEV